LAVVLVGDIKAKAPRELAHLRLGHVAEWKANEVELLARGRKQEIALVAIRRREGATTHNGRWRAPARRARAPSRANHGILPSGCTRCRARAVRPRHSS